jgi:hypothetical protein
MNNSCLPAVLLIFATIIFSCSKDGSHNDYRNAIAGDYSGIRVSISWVDTIVGYHHDTSDIVVTLQRSGIDSLVSLSTSPPISSDVFSYKYSDGSLLPTGGYHPPMLQLTSDSLYLHYQPALGPYWIKCFTKKKS